ncbi:hypothetical protein LYNGBM3L_61310 [Moorena producens 3L]|uniref:Uncharacterized protein n=1 Tax=Moorena producens 3L TaxID=489825 RepID=F4Y0G1_9CYAN|nr:hypothetical protein LYNGBM3L_61310 [Moorena producens 3L]
MRDRLVLVKPPKSPNFGGPNTESFVPPKIGGLGGGRPNTESFFTQKIGGLGGQNHTHN